MELINRFKKDLTNYQIGIIVPGIASILTIFVLKRFLGSADFGLFSLRYNLILLLATAALGWISQSIVRFTHASKMNPLKFRNAIFILSSIMLIVTSIIASLSLIIFSDDGIMRIILFIICFIFCGIQMVFLAYAQAGFYSRDLMVTEILRTVSFLFLAFLTSLFIADYAIECIFISLTISFFLSSLLIARRVGLIIKFSKSELLSGKTKVYILQNFRYGWPLGVWFLIVYIMNYIEKPIIASIHGFASQGEYQVMFDLLSKGSGFVFTPVLFALFPILSNAIENNQHAEIKNILKRIIRIELMILVIAIIFYWFIGFHLISIIFKVPPLEKFKISGLILLISSIIWQISQVLHKPFELRKNTPAMLKGISIALVIYLITLLLVWLLVPHIIYAFAFPFLFACISYLCFILYNLNKKEMLTIKA